MSSWHRESRKLLGSPDVYINLMAWCISRLIYVKLCSNNSLPRRPTNPLDYAFGVCHLNWLLRVEWHEGDGNLCIFQSGRRFIIYCWGRMDPLLLILMRRGWLLGFWNKYLILKDHFVACSRQPSQVFSVLFMVYTIWFNKLCRRNMCIIKFKNQPQLHHRTCSWNHSLHTRFCLLLSGFLFPHLVTQNLRSSLCFLLDGRLSPDEDFPGKFSPIVLIASARLKNMNGIISPSY